MRIFLNGGGSGTKTVKVNQRLNEIIDHTKPILYIPLAMNKEKYDRCYQWITEELKNVKVPYIEMVRDTSELSLKKLDDYSLIFIGGGNTFKLLFDLKESNCFEKIMQYVNNNGLIFGGSAGAIIFGQDLESCILDDKNEVDLKDIKGFDVLNGVSFLCHYTNRTIEKDNESTRYLLELSKRKKIIALPEEVTLFINDNKLEVIGTRSYYLFDKGIRKKINI